MTHDNGIAGTGRRNRRQQKLTAIPLNLRRPQGRAIHVMAVRNGVSDEQQILTMLHTHPELGAQ